MLDRFITTKMSANIIADLLKSGWTERRVASVIEAPLSFVQGVRAKQQVLTFADIRALARRAGRSPHLMLLNAIPQSDIDPHLEALFASTRAVLQATEESGGEASGTAKKRKSSTKAA